MENDYTHIIWDWNGTLLSDVEASLGSVNDMLAGRGRAAITLEQYKREINIPIRGFYEAFFDLATEDYDAILAEYNKGYEQRLQRCGLTPGVREVLGAARGKNIRQAIVSSSENNLILRWLRHFEILPYFDAVLGAADFLAGGKIERAEQYLAQQKADAAKVLVIGDLIHDYEMARTLGADCVLFTSGHHGPAQFGNTGARVLDSAWDVLGLL